MTSQHLFGKANADFYYIKEDTMGKKEIKASLVIDAEVRAAE